MTSTNRIKKFATLFLFCFFLAPSAHALFIQQCHNSGATQFNPVSFSFQSCINRNFREIEYYLDTRFFFQQCHNFGTGVSFAYINCINRNFSEARRAVGGPIFLPRCSNFRSDMLEWQFMSCVNQNFRYVERFMTYGY